MKYNILKIIYSHAGLRWNAVTPRFSEPAQCAGEVRNIRLREQPGGIGFAEDVERPLHLGMHVHNAASGILSLGGGQ